MSRSLDVELLVEMFVGAMFFKLFFGEAAPDDAYVEKLVHRIIGGCGLARRELDQPKRKVRQRKGTRRI